MRPACSTRALVTRSSRPSFCVADRRLRRRRLHSRLVCTSMSKQREPTIADVLTGHTQVTPLMKITAGQRLYYNYHFDQPSLGRETRCLSHARGTNGPCSRVATRNNQSTR